MIRAAFDLLVGQLNQYVRVNNPGVPVVPGNISFLESDAGAGGILGKHHIQGKKGCIYFLYFRNR
jgi:hypothetical protein